MVLYKIYSICKNKNPLVLREDFDSVSDPDIIDDPLQSHPHIFHSHLHVFHLHHNHQRKYIT